MWKINACLRFVVWQSESMCCLIIVTISCKSISSTAANTVSSTYNRILEFVLIKMQSWACLSSLASTCRAEQICCLAVWKYISYKLFMLSQQGKKHRKCTLFGLYFSTTHFLYCSSKCLLTLFEFHIFKSHNASFALSIGWKIRVLLKGLNTSSNIKRICYGWLFHLDNVSIHTSIYNFQYLHVGLHVFEEYITQ